MKGDLSTAQKHGKKLLRSAVEHYLDVVFLFFWDHLFFKIILDLCFFSRFVEFFVAPTQIDWIRCQHQEAGDNSIYMSD